MRSATRPTHLPDAPGRRPGPSPGFPGEQLGIAGARDVRIAGGGETIQEYLDAGLFDEFSVTIAPELFGTGIRLFDGVDLTALP